jgi:hypothetical protein
MLTISVMTMMTCNLASRSAGGDDAGTVCRARSLLPTGDAAIEPAAT